MRLHQPEHLIRLSKSCIGLEEKQAVMGVLDREFLGMGQEVRQFEDALTSFLGRSVACVSNGTAALHLALQACGVGVGDEVLVPSLTYVASFQAISATGATPVACDIDASTLALDWKDAESRLSSRTKAVMPVHYSGGVGNLDEIYAFSHRYGLRVIEDAAHAFGTYHHKKRIGSFGDIACFSFDGIKNITSGEGGCIVTNDPVVLSKVCDARLLGVENDSKKRYEGHRSWTFDVSHQGWRYHMSNLMAAIGLEQLKRFESMASIRCERAKLYETLFDSHESIASLKLDYTTVVPHIYVVRIHGLKNRKALQQRLLEKNIQTGIHYQPNHKHIYYANENAQDLPVTDAVYPEILTLPLHPDLTESDVMWVCDVLKKEVAYEQR